MVLRQLEYLVALAREKHFGRAAEACHVSQPTLSAAIRLLEENIGGADRRARPSLHRIHSAGPDRGRARAPHSRRDRKSAPRPRGDRQGPHRPAPDRGHPDGAADRLPPDGAVLRPISGVTVAVLSLNSQEIERGIEDFELDAGLTYLDAEPIKRVKVKPICLEEYMFLTPAGAAIWPVGRR